MLSKIKFNKLYIEYNNFFLIGGYNKPNASRLWTSITATILNTTLPSDVPEHSVSVLSFIY